MLFRSLKDCECIFHLTARGSVLCSNKNRAAAHDVNTNSTLHILEVARKSRTHFSSSSSVYGWKLQLTKDESRWLGPMTPNVASKMAGKSYL